jgi:hypothetical protein
MRLLMRKKCTGLESEHPDFALIAPQFDYTPNASIEIQLGILEGVSRLSEMSDEFINHLCGLITAANLAPDPKNLWQASLQSIEPAFFRMIKDVFFSFQAPIRAILADYPGARISSNSPIWREWKAMILALLTEVAIEQERASPLRADPAAAGPSQMSSSHQ